jgi:NADPH:quinone reductase and related Zn-dependent oxidoreductases
MKAFIIDKYGTDGRLGEMPDPTPGDYDVLVEVHAAGLNPLDLMTRAGKFKLLLPYRVPFILGNDLAGVVVGIGPKVSRFKVGDEVYARPDKNKIGTFAELIAVHEADLAVKPTTVSMEEAAALPLVALTAWQAFVERAQVKPGQKVLIHAGSGGLGSMAIQLAKHLGATVATTTSTANVDMVTRLGADVVIDYKKQDFAKELSDYDVVLDTLGGETLEKSLRVLKPGGLAIGVTGPPDAAFARDFGWNPALRLVARALSFRTNRRARLHGVTYSFLFMEANGNQLHQIAALVDAGNIQPVVDRVFPFEDTHEALAHLDGGRAKGKVVATMR